MYSYAGRIQARSHLPIKREKIHIDKNTLCLYRSIKKFMLQILFKFYIYI